VLESTSEQVSIMKTASLLTSLKAKIKLAQRKETGSCFVIWKRFVKYMFLIVRNLSGFEKYRFMYLQVIAKEMPPNIYIPTFRSYGNDAKIL
jgi:hypothetical protein